MAATGVLPMRPLVLVLTLAAAGMAPVSALAQELPTAVTEITVEPQEAGGAIVVIQADNPVRYDTFRLSAEGPVPPRLVVDIEGASFVPGVLDLPVGDGGVIGIRASQFSSVPPVVRVVIDLDSARPVRILDEVPAAPIRIAIGDIDDLGAQPGETTEVTPEAPDPIDPPQPPTEEVRPEQALHVLSVDPMGFEEGRVSFRVTLDGPAEPVYFAQATPCRFVLDIPGAAPEMTLGRPDGWASVEGWIAPGIKSVRVFEIPEAGKLSTRIVIDADRLMPYDLDRDPTGPHAWIFSVMVDPALSRVVVIDPGHGGKDCGALDDSETFEEADFVLPIALRLRSKLIERGICPILTRTADTTVDLFHRPYIANQVDAELFLSIHLNALDVGSAGGTLTLYTHPSSAAFAETIQAKVAGALGLTDRGIVPMRDLVVTRVAEMPAVLCELLFIDNPAELALLHNPQNQELVAEALADAIEASLESADEG